jgi:hypothetical protein
MGYYDFNDHFWSPLEVCAQAPKKQPPEKKIRITNLIHTIFSVMPHSNKSVTKKASNLIH